MTMEQDGAYMPLESSLRSFLETHAEQMIDDLKLLVRHESPSTDKALADRCGRVLLELGRRRIKGDWQVIPQPDVGDVYRLAWGDGGPKLLVLAHYDTVWEPGALSLREEGDRLYGPGTYDMKGGIVMAIWAVAALQAAVTALPGRIVALFTSDEEIGSHRSRALIETEAREAHATFVLESAVAGTGALKTARKGVGEYRFRARGVAAHAGNAYHLGKNAITALCKQLLRAAALTDESRGTTVNVGVIRGGVRSNVVPDEAEAWVDVRVEEMDDARALDEAMRSLAGDVDGVSITVEGGLNRPPMERTPNNARLFELAQSLGKRYGLDLTEAKAGGGSDGNFTSALGVPTLDGLGPEGDGAHAVHEHILKGSLVPRTALLAHLLYETLNVSF
ncbi:MAG: M20 family metallopeptidase [Hydrogenibacillus sp.]|nr:M20 family metallopeptidase [Hydrogenibacillus sp.]